MRSHRPKLMTASLVAIVVVAVQAAPAHAGSIIDFSLTNSNSITLSNNGDYTLAFLDTSGGPPPVDGPTGGEQPITISLLDGVTESPPISAYLYLDAVDSGRPSLSPASQNFSGSFAITEYANGTGTNYLSGTFTNWTLAGSGSNASLSNGGSTASATLTSSVINDLTSSSMVSFAFPNVTPDFQVRYENGRPTHVLLPFTAGAAAVPEPSSLVLAGFGALSVVYYSLRRRKASGA